MTYEALIFLFVAVVLTYLILVGILLHRELAVEARENRAKDQKASLLPSDFEYFRARLEGREQMLKILPMAVRYHFERLRPEPANTGYRPTNRGQSARERVLASRACAERNMWLQGQVRYHFYRWLPYYRACVARNVWLQEQVRLHFYRRFPAQQTENRALDSTEYSELEELVRGHFYRFRPTLETERKSAG